MITIGIDPRKSSTTASAIDEAGTQLAVRRFVVNAGTVKQLLGWAVRWPQRRFAIEGAHGLGRGMAQILVAAGENVLDVTSTLAMWVRLLSIGGGRKGDPADAYAVGATTLGQTNLRTVAPEDQTTILGLLAERRDDLVHEHTRVVNRLHQVLRELIPGGVDHGLSADKAATALRRVRPATATDGTRRELAKELVADLRRIDARIKSNEARTHAALAATQTTLQQIPGVGAVFAAKVLGHVGDIGRYPALRTSPATPAPHPWMHPAATTTATGSTPAETANSTPSCTPWQSAKAATPAPAVTTTARRSPKEKRRRKPAEPSNAASRTASTETCARTKNRSANPPRRSLLDTQGRYRLLCSLAPNPMTDGPQRSEYSGWAYCDRQPVVERRIRPVPAWFDTPPATSFQSCSLACAFN